MIKYSICQSVHRQPLAKPVISVAKSKEQVIVYLQMHVNDLLSFTSLYYFHSAMITCDSCSKNIFLNCSVMLNSHGYSHTFFPEYFVSQFPCLFSKSFRKKMLVYQILKTQYKKYKSVFYNYLPVSIKIQKRQRNKQQEMPVKIAHCFRKIK